jgi:lactam utilization protein B
VVVARDGTRIPIAFDTICIHADMEGTLERARSIRKRLG